MFFSYVRRLYVYVYVHTVTYLIVVLAICLLLFSLPPLSCNCLAPFHSPLTFVSVSFHLVLRRPLFICPSSKRLLQGVCHCLSLTCLLIRLIFFLTSGTIFGSNYLSLIIFTLVYQPVILLSIFLYIR